MTTTIRGTHNILIETNYWMNSNLDPLLKKYRDHNIYVPALCIDELEELSECSAKASFILKAIKKHKNIKILYAKELPQLQQTPTIPVKDRSKYIVSYCLKTIFDTCHPVDLLTTSQETSYLASIQNIGITPNHLQI